MIHINTGNNDDGIKTYLVTAKFRVSGDLPDFIEKKHIEGNIASEIQENVQDIALSSEYYQGMDDEEWELYMDSDVEVEVEEFSIRICAEPFCEHCGENHEDFGVEVYDGGTTWCLDCFLSGRKSDFLTKEEIKEIYAKEKELKKKHYLKKLKELESDEDNEDENDEEE